MMLGAFGKELDNTAIPSYELTKEIFRRFTKSAQKDNEAA